MESDKYKWTLCTSKNRWIVNGAAGDAMVMGKRVRDADGDCEWWWIFESCADRNLEKSSLRLSLPVVLSKHQRS